MGLREAMDEYDRVRQAEAHVASSVQAAQAQAAEEAQERQRVQLEAVLELGREAIDVLRSARIRPTVEVVQVVDRSRRRQDKGRETRPTIEPDLTHANALPASGWEGPYTRVFRGMGQQVWELRFGGGSFFLDAQGRPQEGVVLNLREARAHPAGRKNWVRVSDYFIDRFEFEGAAATATRGLALKQFPPFFLDLAHTSGVAHVSLAVRWNAGSSRYPDEQTQECRGTYEAALAEGVARALTTQ